MVAILFTLASLVAAAASLAQATDSSTTHDDGSVVTCTDGVTANAASNPSWESGTAGWTYSWSASTSSDYATDGANSL